MIETLSIVIPAFNEEANIERVYERLSAVLDGLDVEWELIFSVDPCTDATEELILALRERDARVKMLRFSRRFGQPTRRWPGSPPRVATPRLSSTAICRTRPRSWSR